jgi:NO-binding membrane sensor protein with MHYT domain
MTDGLILLGFLGVLAALFTVRMRRRMGLASNTKTWVTVIVGCVILGLALWAAGTASGTHP